MNKKRTIVLASLLKPVDDPRMYEKFALSMAQTNKYAINIIGFSSKNIPSHPSVTIYPAFNFKRLGPGRALAIVKYWRFLLKVKPDMIIVNTHDLLIVSCAYKILFGCRIAYDVQENYLQNIIWSGSLPAILRYPLAYLVRLKEHLAKRMIVHFFLAEKCYMNECSFINGPFTILENKALRPLANKAIHKEKRQVISWKNPLKPVQLLYSGTIAESYGIFDCLDLAERWIKEGYHLQLNITGYCPRADTLRELMARIKNRPYISLTGGDGPVPHKLILQELLKTDFSLVSYRLNPSNKDCFPTRIWECLAYKVPMIMKTEHPWVNAPELAGLVTAVDFQNPGLPPLHKPGLFHFSAAADPSVYWEWEEKKLLQALESMF